MGISHKLLNTYQIDRSNIRKTKMRVPDTMFTPLVGDMVPSFIAPEYPYDRSYVELSHCVGMLPKGEYALDYSKLSINKERQLISSNGLTFVIETIVAIYKNVAYNLVIKLFDEKQLSRVLANTLAISTLLGELGSIVTTTRMEGLSGALFEHTQLTEREQWILSGIVLPISHSNDLSTALGMSYDGAEYESLDWVMKGVLGPTVDCDQMCDILSQFMPKQTRTRGGIQHFGKAVDNTFMMTIELYDVLVQFMALPSTCHIRIDESDSLYTHSIRSEYIGDYLDTLSAQLIDALGQSDPTIEDMTCITISYLADKEIIDVHVYRFDMLLSHHRYDLIPLLIFSPNLNISNSGDYQEFLSNGIHWPC